MTRRCHPPSYLFTSERDRRLACPQEREREERVKEFQRQRDTTQRERARLSEQLAQATAEARAAAGREHQMFLRTTVLEQSLQAASLRAVEIAGEVGSGPTATARARETASAALPTLPAILDGLRSSTEINAETVASAAETVAESGAHPSLCVAQSAAIRSGGVPSAATIEQAMDGLRAANERWGVASVAHGHADGPDTAAAAAIRSR